jgi:hypothetical protein
LFHATDLFPATVQKTFALQFLFAATFRVLSPAVVAALFFFDRDELAMVAKLDVTDIVESVKHRQKSFEKNRKQEK